MIGRIMSRSLGSGNKTGRVESPTSTSGDAPRGRSPHDATWQLNQNFLGQNKGNPETGAQGAGSSGPEVPNNDDVAGDVAVARRPCRSRGAGFHAPRTGSSVFLGLARPQGGRVRVAGRADIVREFKSDVVEISRKGLTTIAIRNRHRRRASA